MWWQKSDKKPDGTIRWHDKNGKTHETWIPPEKIYEWEKQGLAKEVYKRLIKGPWDGVKEDFWDLTEEQVKKFGNADKLVYAICHYENGEPKYALVSKRFWEKLDEIEKLLVNPSLTEEQKTAEIKKLVGE